MSITVVANPTSHPPRYEITITTPAGQTMDAVVLQRYTDGGYEQTRVQPLTGFSSRYIEDYEAPWEAGVTYVATVTYGATTVVYTGPLLTLSSQNAWAIHPTVPAQSVCIDTGASAAMGIVTIGDVSRPSTAVRHTIIGAKNPIVKKTGPRSSSQVPVTIAAVTSADEDALWALIDDQTPLLFRIPPAWGWNWEDGYYDIADASAGRFAQYGPEQRRTFTLQLTRVDSPEGSQQATWSYADILAQFPDYPTLTAAFADYPALLANHRS